MRRRRIPALLVLLQAIVLGGLAAPAVRAAASDDEAVAAQHGWRYLVDKLAADGVPRGAAAAVFADPRVPAFDGLPFNLAPRESPARYRELRSSASVRAARSCFAQHADAFEKAAAREGVPATLVATIVHVETACGRNTGSSTILHRLARLAMANEPENLAFNVRRHAGDPPEPAIAAEVRERAAYLERTFYPEVRGLFTMADHLHIDPLTMEGSGSGAFGFPQFLPTSYLRYGVDGDGDGRVSLYDMDDAAASCARFLAGNGWRPDLSLPERRRVIWQYNRSDAYIDTILTLQHQLDAPDGTSATRTPRAGKRGVRVAQQTTRPKRTR